MNKKKILVAAIHYPVASGRYIAEALMRLGHDVKTVGPSPGTKVWGMDVPERYEWKPNFWGTEVYGIEKANSGWELAYIEEQCKENDFKPDLVLVTDAHYPVMPLLHRQIIEGVPHAVFGVDNHVRDYSHVPGFDHYFFAHHDGPSRPVRAENEHWLPCGYDPVHFYRERQSYQRPLLAGMLGVPYQKRQAVMGSLARWAKNPAQIEARLGALYDEYRDFYNQCLVSVCVSAAGDVAQRIFETAAMGCILLTDRCSDFERLGLVEDEHYLGFDTPEEAVSKMEWLLAQSDENIMALSENAYQWAQPHTWDARCEEMLGVVFDE